MPHYIEIRQSSSRDWMRPSRVPTKETSVENSFELLDEAIEAARNLTKILRSGEMRIYSVYITELGEIQ